MLRERAPASISVSLILTHGRSNRLFVVRQGPESAHPGSYGLIAGGAELKDVSLLHAAFREALEEASISHNHIIFVRGRNDPKPHIAPIITQNSIRLGVVFDATYSGPKLPLEGWTIQHDKKVDRVDLFTWRQVLALLEKPDRIYLPEFNTPQIMRWLLFNYGGNQTRINSIHHWLTHHSLDGMEKIGDEKSPRSLNDNWRYTPPYESWLNIPNLFGDPKRTNFARRRSKWQG